MSDNDSFMRFQPRSSGEVDAGIDPDKLDRAPQSTETDPDHLGTALRHPRIDPDRLEVSSHKRGVDPDRLHVALEQTTDAERPRRSSIEKLNDRVANWMAKALSSMWLFWLLAVLFAVALYLQPPQGADQMIMFYMAGLFAAVALPVLAFVNNITGDRQEALMRKMQDEMLEELKLLKEVATRQGTGTVPSSQE